jgi:hypothetical protein
VAATFKTNPISLEELLKDCRSGKLQLPDFQRSWVWDEDRIKSLIASVSRAFPIGALMTLETGGEVDFKPRPIEGAPSEAKAVKPSFLLLDGQQRMTSLYQISLRGEVVETITARKKKVKRWFYIDIMRALDPSVEREEAIVGLPEARVLRSDEEIDLRTREGEFSNMKFPLTCVFDWDDWQDGFWEYWEGRSSDAKAVFREFKNEVLQNFKQYQVPVISLDKSTSKEAVCLVFEKVNTGGKALDAFELVTAMYAAEGHELRRDWYGKDAEVGRHQRFVQAFRPADSDRGIIADVASTDFLQAISLFHTREVRRAAADAGKQGRELPQITANRQALLNLPLAAYKKYEKQVEDGFMQAAKFLYMLHIYRVFDLPYQSQIVPLAAILADIGDAWHNDAVRQRLVRWYWNGVFGELYGSAAETRIARDFAEVPIWLYGDGDEPTTIRDSSFRAERLLTMRMRLSAAYKGVNALLMKEGAQDFRSGQQFNHIVFFGENVDIHHIFPRKWCEERGIKPDVYDSIINKTPLSYRTNRIVGGDAPSVYLSKLQSGGREWESMHPERLDGFLHSHLINPDLLRADDFEAFMRDRQQRLLELIESATGKAAQREEEREEGVDAEADDDMAEAQLTIAA